MKCMCCGEPSEVDAAIWICAWCVWHGSFTLSGVHLHGKVLDANDRSVTGNR